MLDLEGIKRIIPHREPFLLLDSITELEPGKRAVGLKSVKADDFFFPGHFPGRPIMPGVLIVEALAQVGAVVLLSKPENAGKLVLFAGIEKVRFKRQVVPGDELILETEVVRSKGPIGIGLAKATVGGEVAAQGEIMFAIK